MSPKTPDTYVICDTETTGLDPKANDVIEVALIRIEDGVEAVSFSSLLWPGYAWFERADPKAMQVNGIDPRDVDQAPWTAHRLDELEAILEGATFVAHNADFDADFVAETFRKHRRKPPWELRRKVCTRQLVRQHLFPHGATSTSMDKVRAFLHAREVPGWEVGGDTHRAERDAEDCLRLFQMLWRKDRAEVARSLGLA